MNILQAAPAFRKRRKAGNRCPVRSGLCRRDHPELYRYRGSFHVEKVMSRSNSTFFNEAILKINNNSEIERNSCKYE